VPTSTRSALRVGAVLLALFAAPALADPLAPPVGAVILTVSGRISNTNRPQATAEFDLPMLEALASREGTMETPWTKGKNTFKGPLGRALMQAVGAHGHSLKVSALDDYSVEVPVEDLDQHDVIFATEMNGRPMSVRGKGPLFIIYPFDKEPALYNEKYFSRSVWQIKSIVVH
jgi:hypothetical protein